VIDQLWTHITVSGTPPASRSCHASSLVGDRLVIFGGMHKGKFVNSQTWILELNQKEVRKAIKEEERQRE
jgi:hypothetical protein